MSSVSAVAPPSLITARLFEDKTAAQQTRFLFDRWYQNGAPSCSGGRKEERNRCRQDKCKYVGYTVDAGQKKFINMRNGPNTWKCRSTHHSMTPFGSSFSPEMAKGPISNVYITGGSSANGARYPGRWELWLMFNVWLSHNGSIITHPLLLVTAAPMAPWPPAQTTLTTAGPAWRRQFRIWGMTTTRMSTTRTTTKTNLSEPHHSNKHSPTSHLHSGKLDLLCVLLWPDPRPPVSLHTRVSVWPSQGCRWLPKKKKKKSTEVFLLLKHPHHSSGGAVVQRNLLPSQHVDVFLSPPLLNKPSRNKRLWKATAVGEFFMSSFSSSCFVISNGRRVDPSVPEIAKASALKPVNATWPGATAPTYKVLLLVIFFWVMISNSFSSIMLGWLHSVLLAAALCRSFFFFFVCWSFQNSLSPPC